MRYSKSIKERFEEKFVKCETGCWEWTACKHNTGYGQMSINQKPKLSHRLSWEIYVGEIPEDLCVLHQCDNRLCVNPAHLFLGTRGDNARDCKSKGRNAFGERNGMARLTSKQVERIRDLRRQGHSSKELAEMFTVCSNHIDSIIAGRRW